MSDEDTTAKPNAVPNIAQRRIAMAKAKVGRARAEAMRKRMQNEVARMRQLQAGEDRPE